jgi:DNA helicase-2/ATP-dependent DNA helicase PcrA
VKNPKGLHAFGIVINLKLDKEMDALQRIVEMEEHRAHATVGVIRSTLASETEDRLKKDKEIAALKQQKLDAVGWQEKREIDDLIASHRRQYAMRQYQDSKILIQPYFGVLELADDQLGALSYCLGRQSFFDSKGRALVIDWREAPISRLYYEYSSSEAYEEEIRGRERTGIIEAKRQVEITNEELRRIVEKEITLIRNEDGWRKDGEKTGVIYRKEEKGDHRLPEVTSLISREQFQAITNPESSVVLLQGGAGSGKTTVGLHRIAYLNYQDHERFKPDRILVVVFNRSLQQYISKVLPDLGVGGGVHVETYHSWAGKIFRAAKLALSYSSEDIPSPVARLKKSPFMLMLIERYFDLLLEKARTWFLEQLEHFGEPDLETLTAQIRSIVGFENFYRGIINSSGGFAGIRRATKEKLFPRLVRRFDDHEADLHLALCDSDLMETVSRELGMDVPPQSFEQLARWQKHLKDSKKIDFADTGILLWLLQKKGVLAARPRYSHAMVDEAQDFSEVELAALLNAVDEHQSLTICGDMLQKIKGEFEFASAEGFAGFIKSRQKRMGSGKICAESLVVGYRATKPIMELAWHVLGEKPSMAVHRDGEPVRIVMARGYEQAVRQSSDILSAYMKERSNGLVAVICRYKADADRVFESLKGLGLEKVRRHSRDDFIFTPGIIVTNSHQIKGLEFSAVLAFNPSAGQYRDDRESRMLLHVVLTRAADHLWIVGYQPMAYGLEGWQT